MKYLVRSTIKEFQIPSKWRSVPRLELKPSQLSYFSRDKLGKVLLEDKSSLEPIKMPKKVVSATGEPLYDLKQGFRDFKAYKLDPNAPKMSDLLTLIRQLEQRDGRQIEGDMICSRGVLVDLANINDKFTLVDFQIACTKGQIVISNNNYRDEVITDHKALLGVYSGHKFESLMTSKHKVENASCFKSVVKLPFDQLDVVFSAEVDACIEPGVTSLSNYIELKTQVESMNRARTYGKLYKGALQCLFSGTRVLVIGSRDSSNMLKRIHTIDTFQLLDEPVFNSAQHNFSLAFRFVEAALGWLKSNVDRSEHKAWSLKRSGRNLILQEHSDADTVDVVRKRVIGDEFTKHRQELPTPNDSKNKLL